MPSSKSGRSGWRSLAVAAFVIAIALVEPIAYLAIAIALGEPTSLVSLNERKEQVLRGAARHAPGRDVNPPVGPSGEVVHPYLGFAGDASGVLGTQSLGFGEREPVLHQRSPDRLLVGITGGSLARQFLEVADEVLAPRLSKTPALAERELVILPLANPAWKQPQQLLALDYLLALGGELDVLINIDGWNEVALHAVENQRRGVFPSFPHDWYRRARSLPDPVVLPILGRIAYLEFAREDWAQRLLQAPLRWSALAGGIWLVRDRKLAAEIADAHRLLRELTTTERDYSWSGPRIDFESDEALYDELVSVWSRSSLQLSQLSRTNGILYLHFLEPNPTASVIRGYSLLTRECVRLAAGGVPCHDLNRDSCCPPGRRGSEILGSIIAERIVEGARLTGKLAADRLPRPALVRRARPPEPAGSGREMSP